MVLQKQQKRTFYIEQSTQKYVKLKGEPVYMYPANSTEIKPPVAKENEIIIFENDVWVIKADYRGHYQCNVSLEISQVEKIGELEDGYILITEEQAEKILEDNLYYIVQDGELVENPNYEKEIEQAEKERIAKLFLTGADVERGIFKARGADFEDIINMIGQMQINSDPRTEGIELKALKIELKANHFYRGNPYVGAIGQLLGFTEEQLDKFFETNDYTVLLDIPCENV